MAKKKSPTPPPSPAAIAHLASNVGALRASGIETIAEASVFCAAATTDDATMSDIVQHLEMPFSTVSRVAFSLHERGFLAYDNHPTDRRKKVVRANVERLALAE